MRRGTGATALAILDIAGYAILSVLLFDASGSDLGSLLMFGGAVASFALVGALLIRRVPANPIGALLLATATVQVGGLVVLAYGSLGGSAAPPLPGAAIASAAGDVAYIAPYVVALVGIPLLFPDGRLPSPRFRWIVWVAIATMVAMLLAGLAALVPGLAETDAIGSVSGVMSLGATIIGFGGAAAAIWVRFRRGDPVQRQQLKWLLAVACVAAIAFPAALLLPANEPLGLAFWMIAFLAYLALPVAIAIAVLRYRLYEIDVIINRALVYVPLTAIIAGVYAATVALSGRLLAASGQSSDMAIVLTTLVVVVIFTPVKNAVQAAVDRRFKVVPRSPEPPPSVANHPVELLSKLAELRDRGILTDDEFALKKADLLARL